MPIGTAVDHEKLKKKQRRAKLRTAGLTVALSAIVASGALAVAQGRAAERKAEEQRKVIAERIYNYGEEAGWQLEISESSTLWDIRQKAVFRNEMEVECYQDYLRDLRKCVVDTQKHGRDRVADLLLYDIQCANEEMYKAESEGDANKHLAQKQGLLKVAETMNTIWEEDAQFRKDNHDKLPFQQEEYLNGVLADIGQRQADADKAQRAYQYQKQNQYHGR